MINFFLLNIKFINFLIKPNPVIIIYQRFIRILIKIISDLFLKNYEYNFVALTFSKLYLNIYTQVLTLINSKNL